MSNTDECKSLVRSANAVLGKVDILVSNAGEGNATPSSDKGTAFPFGSKRSARGRASKEVVKEVFKDEEALPGLSWAEVSGHL